MKQFDGPIVGIAGDPVGIVSTIDRVIKLLNTHQFELRYEHETQSGIAGVLTKYGIGFTREAKLGPGSRVDFMCQDGVAIEVKLGGEPRNILRQVTRYCGFGDVKAVVLATNRAMMLPQHVLDKPCVVVRLGTGWL